MFESTSSDSSRDSEFICKLNKEPIPKLDSNPTNEGKLKLDSEIDTEYSHVSSTADPMTLRLSRVSNYQDYEFYQEKDDNPEENKIQMNDQDKNALIAMLC